MAKKKPTKQRQPKPRQPGFVRDIGDIGTPLSGPTLVSAAGQLVKREYDPQFRDIKRAELDTDARRQEQQARAKAYYADIAKLFGASLGGQQASNNAAIAAATGARDQQLGAIDSAQAEADKRRGHDQQVRGQGLDGGAMDELAKQAAQAKMRAQAQGATQENAARNFGAAQEALLRGIGAATQQRGGETQAAIGARSDALLADLAGDRRKLESTRQGALTDTLLKMRQNEVERLLTEKGISSDLTQAQIDADLKAADIQSRTDLAREKMRFQVRLEQMGIDADQAKQMADQQFRAQQKDLDRQNAVTVAGMRGAGANGFSRKDKVKAAGKRDDALVMAEQLKAGSAGMRANRNEALTILTDKYGSDFARVAVGAIYDGGAKPHLVQLMHDRYGIDIPRQYLRR